MGKITLRPGNLDDSDAVLRLNGEAVAVTSPLDAARLEQLVGHASLFTVAERHDEVVAFLLGIGEDTPYDSVNYRWFAQRLRGFLYVDRVVVERFQRRRGLGRLLYQRAEVWARDAGLHWLAAEIDVDPPNTASLRFHDLAGFLQVGTLRLPQGKLESMRVKPLAT